MKTFEFHYLEGFFANCLNNVTHIIAEDQLPDLLVANTDVTIQAPIDEYYQNLAVRLEELKREFTNIEARQGHEQTFEDYIQGDREFAEGVQQNSQRYYDALKVLRADTQVCRIRLTKFSLRRRLSPARVYRQIFSTIFLFLPLPLPLFLSLHINCTKFPLIFFLPFSRSSTLYLVRSIVMNGMMLSWMTQWSTLIADIPL